MEEEVQVKSKRKIGNGAAAVLIFVAIVFDLFTLIPFVGDFIGPIFWIGANVYFWMRGMGILNARRLGSAAVSVVIELVPVLQWIPSITAAVIAVIVMTRLEEKTGVPVTSMASKGGPANSMGRRAPTGAVPPPLNSGGMRLPEGK